MFIRKLQQLPEKKRKAILWGILAVIALVLITWFVNNVRETIIRYAPLEVLGEKF